MPSFYTDLSRPSKARDKFTNLFETNFIGGDVTLAYQSTEVNLSLVSGFLAAEIVLPWDRHRRHLIPVTMSETDICLIHGRRWSYIDPPELVTFCRKASEALGRLMRTQGEIYPKAVPHIIPAKLGGELVYKDSIIAARQAIHRTLPILAEPERLSFAASEIVVSTDGLGPLDSNAIRSEFPTGHTMRQRALRARRHLVAWVEQEIFNGRKRYYVGQTP